MEKHLDGYKVRHPSDKCGDERDEYQPQVHIIALWLQRK
jgi:hypothetical protein